jgi:hypothetical protein
LPSGHPEGFIQAFANIYAAAFPDIVAGVKSADPLYPTVLDGLEGVHFTHQCVASSNENGAWQSLRHPLIAG